VDFIPTIGQVINPWESVTDGVHVLFTIAGKDEAVAQEPVRSEEPYNTFPLVVFTTAKDSDGGISGLLC